MEVAAGERRLQCCPGCSSDHAELCRVWQTPWIDEAKRTLNRVPADEQQNVVFIDTPSELALVWANLDRLNIDDRE